MIKSAYIHIPFCKSICSYCDFCKIFYNKEFVCKYLNSLEKEIKDNYKNEVLDTLYIGGGTPSSLSIDELKKLFEIIKILRILEEEQLYNHLENQFQDNYLKYQFKQALEIM